MSDMGLENLTLSLRTPFFPDGVGILIPYLTAWCRIRQMAREVFVQIPWRPRSYVECQSLMDSPFLCPVDIFPSSLLSTTAAAMTGHAQKNVECICTHNGERKERREREELSKPRTRIASHTHRILPIARERFPIQKIPLCFFPPRPTVARQQRRPVERCGHKREREKQTNIQIFLGRRERDWEKRGGDEARQQETPPSSFYLLNSPSFSPNML